jgi:chloride channel protein, CIC family
MIMCAEMCGSFSVLPDAMVAVGIAYLLISRTDVTIYRARRLSREAAEGERQRDAQRGSSRVRRFPPIRRAAT